MVRTWLAGERLDPIPEDDVPWEAILSHLLAAHSVTPAKVPGDLLALLPDAKLTMRSAEDGISKLQEHLAGELPPGSELKAELEGLLRDAERARYPSWPPPRSVLCRGDCNRFNFLLQRTLQAAPADVRCLSFDWEYGGWGDPAFEVTELLCAPTFVRTPPERKRWFVERYAARGGDKALAVRAEVYEGLMQAWWAIRFARFLEEIRGEPTPGDEGQHERVRSAYERRLALTREALQRGLREPG